MANAVVLWVIVYFCVTSVNTKDTFLTFVKYENIYNSLIVIANIVHNM